MFLALLDECYDSDAVKYVYQVCMFDKALQKEGYQEADIGKWGRFEEAGGVTKMVFENGAYCWEVRRREGGRGGGGGGRGGRCSFGRGGSPGARRGPLRWSAQRSCSCSCQHVCPLTLLRPTAGPQPQHDRHAGVRAGGEAQGRRQAEQVRVNKCAASLETPAVCSAEERVALTKRLADLEELEREIAQQIKDGL